MQITAGRYAPHQDHIAPSCVQVALPDSGARVISLIEEFEISVVTHTAHREPHLRGRRKFRVLLGSNYAWRKIVQKRDHFLRRQKMLPSKLLQSLIQRGIVERALTLVHFSRRLRNRDSKCIADSGKSVESAIEKIRKEVLGKS